MSLPRSILLLYVMFTLQGSCLGSQFDSVASEFKVAYLKQFSSSSRIDMIILTESVSQVEFSISSLNGSIHNGTTTRDIPATVTLPSTLAVREATYYYRHLGLLVTSPPDKPISVVLVGWTQTPRSTYLALPCIEQPVQEYVYYGVSANTTRFLTHSQVLLVGCRDYTTVTITPTHDVQLPDNTQSSTSSTINVAAGSSHTITLHSLQTLLIGAPNVDLSGTKIVSNYPLTVVSGHECANIPDTYEDCDPISTQIPPTINWGKQFLLTPLYSRTNGQKYKIIASEENTNVAITCGNSSINTTLMTSGSFFEYDTIHSDFCDLLCNQSCYVSELCFSRNYPGNVLNNGDPILMTVPPISQYPHSVTFTTLPDMPTNFYSIAVPADSYYNGTVIINGSLTTLNWTPIRDTNGVITGYGYNTTANGSSTISHSHPNGRIYVSAYGFSTGGGYGYIAGILLQPINCVPIFTFNSTVYYATEGDNEAMIFIQKQRINSSVNVIQVSSKDFNKTVTFAPGESFKAVSIPIPDDHYTGSTEYISLTINSETNEETCAETTIAIKDNDDLTIGFTGGMISDGMEEISIGIGIYSGIFKPGYIASINLQIKNSQDHSSSINNTLEFQSSIDSYTITFNATQLATELNLIHLTNIIALLLPFDDDDLLVSVSPATLNITSESPKPSSASSTTTYSDTATNLCTPSISITTTTSTSLSTVQPPASTIYVTVEPTRSIAVNTVYVTVQPTGNTVYVTIQPTRSITVNTVYVTVQPTDAVSTQASSDDINSSIIGGLLVIIVIVITIISVIAAIIMYRCGKKTGQMESIKSTATQNSATEMKRVPYGITNPVAIDSPTSDSPQEMYTEMASVDPPPPPLMRSNTDSYMHLNQYRNVDTNDPHPRAYTMINTATMDRPTTYDDVTSPLPPPPQIVGDLPDPEEEIYEDMTATAL